MQEETIGFCDIQDLIKAYESYEERYHLLLAYGSAELINENYIKKVPILKYIDVVWSCPQVRYLFPKINRQLETTTIQHHIIDMNAFAHGDLDKIAKEITSKL